MRLRSTMVSVIKYIILTIFVFIIVIFPFWVVIINSGKTLVEANSLGIGLPSEWKFIENYKEVIIEGEFLVGLKNTIIITLFSSLIILFISALASWVFARSKLKFISFLYYISISGILIPPAIITTIKVMKTLHIFGTCLGLILFYCGIFIPLAIFFMTGFIKTIPIELEDSARVDGCSSFRIFIKIILPLLKPILITCSIFLVLNIWNNFIYPFYFLKNVDQWTLTLNLFNYASKFYHQAAWNLVFTGVILVSTPLLIFFIFLQKRIVSGLLGGALKG